jgi:hypothetical protein
VLNLQAEFSVTCTLNDALTVAVCAGEANAAAQVATTARRRCEFIVILKTHAEDMAGVPNPENGL